ncbi:MAG: PHP domain-containing protein [DPANN group archaeon]|nr:PHP domain-containing protein [DPANN group archaeon]
MKIDFHTHTIYSSDGFIEIKDAILRAKQVGLDCIAITDHNTIKGHTLAKQMSKKYNFPVILGCEVKTISGDILALDISEPIKPKRTILETIDSIHDQGGIAIAAHPYSFFMYHRGVGRKFIDYKFDAVEVFNARTFIGNGITQNLAVKHNISKVAGSDAHTLSEIGNVYTSVKADNISGALKEVRRGNTKLFGKNITTRSIIRWYSLRLKKLFDI